MSSNLHNLYEVLILKMLVTNFKRTTIIGKSLDDFHYIFWLFYIFNIHK